MAGRLRSADHLPTGGEIVRDYLQPLSQDARDGGRHRDRRESHRHRAARNGQGDSNGREDRPFVLSVVDKRRHDAPRHGARRHRCIRNLDAARIRSAETACRPRAKPSTPIASPIGIPDVLGRDRALYAGRRIAVVGAGYSAANVLLDLAKLAESEPKTSIVWIVRGTNLIRVYGGGLADGLPARGELGADVKALVDSGQVTLVTGFSTTAVRSEAEGIVLEGETAEGAATMPVRSTGSS